MSKYRRKPEIFEIITFEELVEYGKLNSDNLVDGIPWSFEYNGYQVTHEHNECYLIITNNNILALNKGEYLIIDTSNNISICNLNTFKNKYEKVED